MLESFLLNEPNNGIIVMSMSNKKNNNEILSEIKNIIANLKESASSLASGGKLSEIESLISELDPSQPGYLEAKTKADAMKLEATDAISRQESKAAAAASALKDMPDFMKMGDEEFLKMLDEDEKETDNLLDILESGRKLTKEEEQRVKNHYEKITHEDYWKKFEVVAQNHVKQRNDYIENEATLRDELGDKGYESLGKKIEEEGKSLNRKLSANEKFLNNEKVAEITSKDGQHRKIEDYSINNLHSILNSSSNLKTKKQKTKHSVNADEMRKNFTDKSKTTLTTKETGEIRAIESKKNLTKKKSSFKLPRKTDGLAR